MASLICKYCHSSDVIKFGKYKETQFAKLEKLGYYKGMLPSIEEALNSGDGTYHP